MSEGPIFCWQLFVDVHLKCPRCFPVSQHKRWLIKPYRLWGISRCRFFWHGLDWRSLCRLYRGCISYLGSLHRKKAEEILIDPHIENYSLGNGTPPRMQSWEMKVFVRDRSPENVMSSWWWLAYWVVDPTYPRYLLFAFNVRLVYSLWKWKGGLLVDVGGGTTDLRLLRRRTIQGTNISPLHKGSWEIYGPFFIGGIC